MRGFAHVLGLGNQQPMPSKKVEVGKERFLIFSGSSAIMSTLSRSHGPASGSLKTLYTVLGILFGSPPRPLYMLQNYLLCLCPNFKGIYHLT